MSPRVLRVGSRVRHIVFALALSSAFALSSAAGSAAASDESARVSPRIIGGTLAPAGTWPSLVALVASGGNPASGQFCGGTLIAKRWVLTAAHCLVDASGNAVPPGDQYVFAGQHDLTAPGEEIEVSRVLVNPNYDDTSTVNDIALLELTNASSQSVRPVIKPSQTDSWQPGDPALVAGWGGVVPQPVGCPGSPGCPAQTYSNELREVQVAVVDDADCGSEYGSFFDSPSM
ncbi:MAG: S1 family peptidase, partial [bacterium]